MLAPEIEGKFCHLLALVYRSVRWSKMSTSKKAWDIWNHRIRAASTRRTLGEFISRLCNQLGLQSLPLEAADLLSELKPHESALLDLAYREHIPIAMRAVQIAKGLKSQKED